ncbi:MAG TPA: oligosaccharide flippase family protein, partial [Vicinamibacterales bacterium]|nr:oligosaccharide flippase family protein [Vicinamibacterales bacterium]
LSPSDVRIGQMVLAILGARIALSYPMTVFGAVVNARHGFVQNNTIAIGLVLLNAIATYVVLELGGGLVALVAWTTALNAAGYLAYAWSAWNVFPELHIHVRHFSRADWFDVTAYSMYVFIIGLGSQISFNVDNLVVGAYLGTAAVAVYAVAVRVSEYQRRVCDQFSGMLFPLIVRFDAQKNNEALRTALVDGARVSTLLAAGVTTCLVGFARPLMVHWMGPGFDGSVAPFYVLAAVGVLMVSHASQASVLMATGSHRIVACVWIVEGVANLALSLALVKPLGSVGVAVGTLVPMAIGHVFVFTPLACRRVGLSIGEFLWLAGVPAVVSVVPAAAICVALRLFAPPATTIAVVGEAAVAGLTFAATCLAVGLDAPTRALYRSQLVAAFHALTFRRLADLEPQP